MTPDVCCSSTRTGLEVTRTSPGQLSGRLFSDPSVGPGYNHCLSVDLGFTWAGASSQMVPVGGETVRNKL